MIGGGVWIPGYLPDLDGGAWKECFVCNKCMAVSTWNAMACPKCGQKMVGVADPNGAITQLADAVVQLDENDARIE